MAEASFRTSPGARGLRLLDIQCASCGAPASYDIVRHSYACAYCGNETGIGTAISQRKGFRELRQGQLQKDADSFMAQSYSCTGCGATVVIPQGEALQGCSFCGRTLVRGEYAHNTEFPELIIGFRLTPEEAKERFVEWCTRNARRREARRLRASLDSIQGYYLPYQLIRGPIDCQVSREGAARTFSCGGFLDGIFVNTTSQLDNLTLNAMEPFDLRELDVFEYGYLAHQRAKVDELGRRALDARVKAEVAATYGKVIEQTLETKNIQVSLDSDKLMKMPVLLPVYFVSKDGLCAAVNGQTGKVAVREEKVRKTLPWWIRPIVATLVAFVASLAIATRLIGSVDGALPMAGMFTLVMGLIFYTAYSNAYEGEERRVLDPRIFTSNEVFVRNPDGTLSASTEPIQAEPVQPMFFEDVHGMRTPVQIRFTTVGRTARMLALGLAVVFLPIIIAFVLNGFDYRGLNPGGSAVWLCIFVPVVPAYYIKMGRIDIYENPYVYTIDERGRRHKVRTKSRTTTVMDVLQVLFSPPLLAAGLALLLFLVMGVYLTLGG